MTGLIAQPQTLADTSGAAHAMAGHLTNVLCRINDLRAAQCGVPPNPEPRWWGRFYESDDFKARARHPEPLEQARLRYAYERLMEALVDTLKRWDALTTAMMLNSESRTRLAAAGVALREMRSILHPAQRSPIWKPKRIPDGLPPEHGQREQEPDVKPALTREQQMTLVHDLDEEVLRLEYRIQTHAAPADTDLKSRLKRKADERSRASQALWNDHLSRHDASTVEANRHRIELQSQWLELTRRWALHEESLRSALKLLTTDTGIDLGSNDRPATQQLSKVELAILQALNDARSLVYQDDLVEVVSRHVGGRLSRKTVSACLKQLRLHGLAEQPKGLKKGHAITDRGRDRLLQSSSGYHPGAQITP